MLDSLAPYQSRQFGKIDHRCRSSRSTLSPDFLILERRAPSGDTSRDCNPKESDSRGLILFYKFISMQLPLALLMSLVFLDSTRGLPTPNESSMAPFRVFPLAYERWDLSPLKRQNLTTRYSTVNRSQIWGGTPANTSICRSPALWTGRWWWIMGSIAFSLVALYGLLAFVMWGILSVDLPRLTVWNRTGDERRR